MRDAEWAMQLRHTYIHRVNGCPVAVLYGSEDRVICAMALFRKDGGVVQLGRCYWEAIGG